MENKQEINTAKAPAAIGPYSQAITFGELVFASGQIPLDPATGAVIEGDIAQQTKRVFENIRAILEEAGSGFSKVIKVTVFLKDMSDFGQVNKIYGEYFEKPYPARSCVEVSRLPKDVSVEIEVVASK